ncbi:MAG: response regulator [Verrucomicrobiae bacterium]|nr:response regulator [Verrucomicrobiae bacterium]
MPIKILTVDDSKTIRLIVAKAFKPFDCEVFEASNGVEGLAVAAKERPHVIILDLTMPVMDGYEALTKLKSDPDLKSIPVVMLTAESGRENVLRIAKQGVRDYLVKPFKEELIVERVGRIIDLKPKGLQPVKARRFDDALSILVVDDKPAIGDQVRAGLADTQWTVVARGQAGEALDYCHQTAPDAVLVSLTLPDDSAFSLFQALRGNARTKSVPVFAMCVKNAVEDQARAQQSGFTGVITKPIEFEELKGKVARALSLDTSYKYFQHRDGVLVLSLPVSFNGAVANEVSSHLRAKVAEAVDAGFGRVVFDVSALKSADILLIKLGLEVMQFCNELSLRLRMIGSPVVIQECRKYEETKDWSFASSFEDALTALNGREVPVAA